MIITIDEYDTVRIYYYNKYMQVEKAFMWKDDLDFLVSDYPTEGNMEDIRQRARYCRYEILHDDGEE